MFVRSALSLDSAMSTTKNIRKHHSLYPSLSTSFVFASRHLYPHTRPCLPRRPRPSKNPLPQTKHHPHTHPLKMAIPISPPPHFLFDISIHPTTKIRHSPTRSQTKISPPTNPREQETRAPCPPAK